MAISMPQNQDAEAKARPLRVIIIGAGIAGLTLGIVLRKNGHDVQIYEQSKFAQELGAAVHIAPNAHGLVKKLGIDLAATGANEVLHICEYSPSGKINRMIDARQTNKIWQHTWMLAHRVRLHEALKEKALGTDMPGRPCELHLSSSVVDVDPENSSITLKDGTIVTGDVVVGADGVHSKSRHRVPGGENARTFGSGKSGFRFMIRRDEALRDPVTKPLCQKDGVFSVVVGPDRRIVMYPTSNNTLLNFLCIHPDADSEAGDDWNTSTSKDALLTVYQDFAPEFKAMLAKADPDSLKLWKLLDMENLPTWVKSRFALIGDAAHPFLPHQGQGAAVAMEDAVALGIVLEQGLKAQEVPERLKLYNDIRYERACKIQQYTRMAGLDVQDNKLNTIEYAAYNFGHDEFDNAAQKLREWKWARLSRNTTRMPVGFGPSLNLTTPSSEDDGYLSAGPATFSTVSVTFQTSRTLIRNLLPPGVKNFQFETPGSLSTCTLAQTTINGATRLQGGNCNIFGLYIHGISYVTSHGDKIRGSYVPIIFQDDAGSVVHDREEYGLPVVYSPMTVERNSQSYRASLGPKGSAWASITLEEANPVPLANGAAVSPTANVIGIPGEQGLLSWRAVPKFGTEAEGNGNLDEFAVWVPFSDIEPTGRIEAMWETSRATVQFDPVKGVPRLQEAISRLAEIPVYQNLKASVVTGAGTPGFAQARRVE